MTWCTVGPSGSADSAGALSVVGRADRSSVAARDIDLQPTGSTAGRIVVADGESAAARKPMRYPLSYGRADELSCDFCTG